MASTSATTTTAAPAAKTNKQTKQKEAPPAKVIKFHIILEHPQTTGNKFHVSQVVAAIAPESDAKFVAVAAPQFHVRITDAQNAVIDKVGDDSDIAAVIANATAMTAKDSDVDAKLVSLCAAIDSATTAEELSPHITALNTLLATGPWVHGAVPTIAEARIFVALSSHKAYTMGRNCPNLSKWFQGIKGAAVLKTAHAAPAGASAESKNKSRTGSQGRRDLKGVTPGMVVCTRFPPEPSGYLHIGHIKAALLNEFYAREYKGKLLLRFDDTNPAKEKVEFMDSIIADLKTVGIVADSLTYTSDHFPFLIECAERMIREGNAYIDNSPKDVMKAGRRNGIESPCRNQTVEQNLALFEEMKAGTAEGQKCVMRGKISMSNPNKVLRDPSLWRCNSTPHHRTGTKYLSYPLYDFAIPIVDSIEGVTHALRSSEYHDRNPLYDWVVDTLKMRKPIIEDFSRLNFAYVLLSKRKLQWFVDNGFVEDWTDPRFPTVQGLMRRGLTVEAMREFVLSQGASKSLNLMSMDKLWTVNKKIIDPIVPRYTAISVEPRPFILTITDGPEKPFTKTLPKHKKNATLGNKIVTFAREVYLEPMDAAELKAGEEVTLMDWGNVIVNTINMDSSTATGHLNPGGSFKDTKKLTWLAATPGDTLPVTIVEYDHLIDVKKIEKGDNFEAHVVKNSMATTSCVGDANLRLLQRGQQMQLERRGYFVCDAPCIAKEGGGCGETPIKLVLTPDGSPKCSPFCKITLKF